MDLGAPVMIAPNGTKFKALFAPLILDLDSRVNLNTAGNVRGLNQVAMGSTIYNPGHRSNQGWGPWEVNLQWIFNNQLPVGANGWQWDASTGAYTYQSQPASSFEWPNKIFNA